MKKLSIFESKRNQVESVLNFVASLPIEREDFFSVLLKEMDAIENEQFVSIEIVA